MEDLIKRLKDQEGIIRRLQRDKAKLDGQRDQLINRLMTEFAVKTVEEALEKLDKLQAEKEANDAELVRIDNQMDDIIKNSKQ